MLKKTILATDSDNSYYVNMSEISFCLRLKPLTLRPTVSYVFESGQNSNNNSDSNGNLRHDNNDFQERFHLLLATTAEGAWAGIKGHTILVPMLATPRRWTSFCFAHSGPRRSATAAVDGKIVLDIVDDKMFEGKDDTDINVQGRLL